MGSALVLGKGHDVLVLLLLGLGGEISSTGGDALSVLREERKDVDIRVVQARVLTVLGKNGTKLRLVLAVGGHDLDHWFFRMVGDVIDQLRVGSWGLIELDSHGDGIGEERTWSYAGRVIVNQSARLN